MYSLEQPAKLFLADCVQNLSNLLKNGEQPTMDLVLFGVTFELRIKPSEAKEMKQADCEHAWQWGPIAGEGRFCRNCGKHDLADD